LESRETYGENTMTAKDHEDPHPASGKTKDTKDAGSLPQGALPPATEHGQPFTGSINEPPGSQTRATLAKAEAKPEEPKPAPKETVKHEEPPRRRGY
jgi:hypothetical protein